MINFPKSEWIYNWGIDTSNAIFLDKFIKENKPQFDTDDLKFSSKIR